MTPEEYISSGIIELYAMGVLPPAEVAKVEAMLREHPELQRELEHIQQSLEHLAGAQALTPPPQLKEKIRSRISFNSAAEFNTHQEQQPFTQQFRIIRNYRMAVAASITLVMMSSAIAYYYKTQYQQTRSALAEVTARQNLLSDELEKASYNSGKMKEEMQVLKNPDIKMVTMKGMPTAPEAMAMVYWNPVTKEAYVSVKNLPPAAENEQYQLWALVDGKPVDAGVFELSTDTLQKVKDVSAAQTFAVTLEKRGGSPSPTLEKLTVIGNI